MRAEDMLRFALSFGMLAAIEAYGQAIAARPRHAALYAAHAEA